MKKILCLTFAFFLLCATAPYAFASVAVEDDGTYEGESVVIDFRGPEVTFDGSKSTVYTGTWASTGEARQVDFGLRGWDGVAYDTNAEGRTTSASPYYVYVSGGADYIVFPGQGQVATAQNGSPIEYTFRVPDDYTSTAANQSAAFIVHAANSDVDFGNGDSTPNYIDWDIVINRDGSAVSTTRYDQTPVALASNALMDAVTLTYATPADLQAGDIVTVRIWRVYEAKGSATGRDATSDLRVYGVSFKYIAMW